MKTILINELDDVIFQEDITLDLRKRDIQHCVGCWTCWWETPGRCIHKDLDDFYHHYVTADKAVFFAEVKKGFVSGNLKSLFDRMIPLFLPYVTYKTGESMHVPRYEHYPDIEFYYEDKFDKDSSRKIYTDYIERVFYQFHSNSYIVKPVDDYPGKAGETK